MSIEDAVLLTLSLETRWWVLALCLVKHRWRLRQGFHGHYFRCIRCGADKPLPEEKG